MLCPLDLGILDAGGAASALCPPPTCAAIMSICPLLVGSNQRLPGGKPNLAASSLLTLVSETCDAPPAFDGDLAAAAPAPPSFEPTGTTGCMMAAVSIRTTLLLFTDMYHKRHDG